MQDAQNSLCFRGQIVALDRRGDDSVVDMVGAWTNDPTGRTDAITFAFPTTPASHRSIHMWAGRSSAVNLFALHDGTVRCLHGTGLIRAEPAAA